MKYCNMCGNELFDEAVICPKCGCPAPNMEMPKAPAKKKSLNFFSTLLSRIQQWSKKKKLIVGGVCIALVAVVIAVNAAGGSAFDRVVSKMLQEYPYADNTRASDGSYLKIDTNPNDKDTDDFLQFDYSVQRDSLNGIKMVNKELGFSDAIYSKMLETTALMGRQTEENSKYRISWKYHPDSGLEVMYEKK